MAIRRGEFRGFGLQYGGRLMRTSVAVAEFEVVSYKPLSIAVNALGFMFNDDLVGAADSPVTFGVLESPPRLLQLSHDIRDNKPNADLAKIRIFCNELASYVGTPGEEVNIVFVTGVLPVLSTYVEVQPKEQVMHEASMRLMEAALERFVVEDADREVTVLDVGSYDLNGSYREMITKRGWWYTGLDIQPGPNVDVYTENPYHYPIKTGQWDIVISGSVAYAVLDLVSWTKEIARVLRPGGLLVVITPSLTKPATTASPADLWRMTDDALRLLFENTGILGDIQVEVSHHDVCASAIRLRGEIDEPKTSPVYDEPEPDTIGDTGNGGTAGGAGAVTVVKPRPAAKKKTGAKR